jgi:excisionase family DNA binding protein
MDKPIIFSRKRAYNPITQNEPAVGTGREMSPMEKILFDLPQKNFLSPEEVASFLSMSLRRVYRLNQEGVIQGIRLDQSLRISRDSLLQYINNGIGK